MARVKRCLTKLTNFLATIGKPFFHLLLFLPLIIGLIFSFFWRIFIFTLSTIHNSISTLFASAKKLFLFFSQYNILKRVKKNLFLKIFIYFVFPFAIAISFYFLILKDLPSPNQLIARDVPQTTKIYDRHGQLLYQIYHDQNRTLVPLEKIPENVKNATIAIEDADFYHHRGISVSGLARALKQFLLQGEPLQGGSTISQQLVKNALLTPEKTLTRKTREIILAFLVENRFSKEEILEMYLNEISYGSTAYGIEAASQFYFGKSCRDLSLSEAAFLAGLPASPTTFSPFGAYPQMAKIRQAEVLRRMREEGFINDDQFKKAKSEELKLNLPREEILAPHFVMFVRDELTKLFPPRLIEEGGLQVKTTLDLEIQKKAETIVAEEVKKIKAYQAENGAALVTNPKTGEILAMVGSRDYFDQEIEGNFNVTTALRQPGSAIKVVNYALALQNGYTLATIIPDTPVAYQLAGSPPYSPQNYDGRFHGPVTLRTALASSYNVPAVKVLASLGPEKMAQLGREMGITTWDDPSRFGLSLTLGGVEVKMTDLAVVYGVLANSGKKTPLQTIIEVSDSSGKILWHNPCLALPQEASSNFNKKISFFPAVEAQEPACQNQVIPAGVAFLLTDVLADNSARQPAFGANSLLYIPGQTVAVKTGTSNNLRDNWAIGYTHDFLVAAWVGNNDNQPMKKIASGVTGATPIWRQITDFLLEKYPSSPFLPPPGVVKKKVCQQIDREKNICLKEREEWFLEERHE